MMFWGVGFLLFGESKLMAVDNTIKKYDGRASYPSLKICYSRLVKKSSVNSKSKIMAHIPFVQQVESHLSRRDYSYCQMKIRRYRTWKASRYSRQKFQKTDTTFRIENLATAELGTTSISTQERESPTLANLFNKYSILGEVIPISSLLIPSAGFSAGLFVRRNLHVEYSYTRGSAELGNLLDSAGVKTDIPLSGSMSRYQEQTEKTIEDVKKIAFFHKQSLFKLRWLLGDSFYLSAGGGLREMGVYYPAEKVTDVRGLNVVAAVERPGLIFGSGNQWNWKMASFRINWLEVFVPAAASSSLSWIDSQGDGGFNKFTAAPSVSLLNLGGGIVL